MPPRHRSSSDPGLTPENLSALAEGLAAGKRVTVFLRDATPGLGLPEGASARVVRIDGNTLTLRPRGVDDELPFEAEEVRLTKLPVNEPKPARTPRASAPVTPAPRVAAPVRTPAPAPAPEAVPEVNAASRVKPRSTKKPTAGVSVTIAAGPEDEWTVTVAHGTRKSKSTTVPADAVDRAIRELGDSTATEAVETALLAARKSAADRVEELSKQLAAARDALAALG